MDFTGIKFMSDKKQSNFHPYRFASTAMNPLKTMDYPFVKLNGSVDADASAPVYNPNTNNPSLVSQARSCKTEMVGGFVGSKSQSRATNREPHQVWDVVIGKLVERCAQDCYATLTRAGNLIQFPALQQNILGLFRDGNLPVASFIIDNNAASFLNSPAEKSSPQPPKTNPVHIKLSEHLAPHMPTPFLAPRNCHFANFTSYPIASRKQSEVKPAVLLYKDVDTIGGRSETCDEPIAEQKSYAEVAKMAGAKCSAASGHQRAARHLDGRRYQKRGYGRRTGNRAARRSEEHANWRERDEGSTRDVRRDAFRPVQKDGVRLKMEPVSFRDRTGFKDHPKFQPDPQTQKHLADSVDNLETSQGVPFARYQSRVVPNPSKHRHDFPRHDRHDRRAAKPRIVHEKHPNFDKHLTESEAESCRYYNPEEDRCANWRCRHNGNNAAPRRCPEYTPPPRRDATLKNTFDKYVRRPCEKIMQGLPSCGDLVNRRDPPGDDNDPKGSPVQKNLTRMSPAAEEVASKRRTISEESDDSFVVFGAADLDAEESSSDWSDDDEESDDESDDGMVCLTMEFDEEMCVSPRMRDVNARWEEEVGRGGRERRGDGKKVQFAPEPRLAEVHPMVLWDFAYRAARCGPWEEMARDRERFRQRVQRSEPALTAVLAPEHRQRVWRSRATAAATEQ